MRIGLFVGALELMRNVAERLDRISDAEADGFDSYWLPQHFGADMLTIIAMAGMQTHRIELGTAVVPTYPRHPVALAQQALTAQVATGGAPDPGHRRIPPFNHRGTGWVCHMPTRRDILKNTCLSSVHCSTKVALTFTGRNSGWPGSYKFRMPTWWSVRWSWQPWGLACWK